MLRESSREKTALDLRRFEMARQRIGFFPRKACTKTTQANRKIPFGGRRPLLVRALTAAFCLTLVSSAKAQCQPGVLDNSFNSTGKVITPIGSNYDEAYSVAIQSDGKIVVGGLAVVGSTDFAVVRYTSTGSLDTSFNDTGIVTTPVGSSVDQGYSVAIQSDGKIVIAGFSLASGSGSDFAVVRYNSDGSLDSSFNGTGKVTTPIGSGDELGRAVAIQSDGKIVVAGQSDNGSDLDFAVVRYNSDGSLDTSFNGSGKVTTPISSGRDTGSEVAIQSDGKIVVAGTSASGTTFDIAVVRYNSDGSLDTSFNSTGKVTTGFGGNSFDVGNAVKIQSDGKIVVAGQSNFNGNFDVAVVRYNADGTLDTSFNGTGKALTSVGDSSDFGESVVIQSDGKIVVGGAAVVNGNGDFAVVRYNSDGSLDTSFNGTGKVTADVGSGPDDAHAMAIQSDGKIVLAGLTGSFPSIDFAVARFVGSCTTPPPTTLANVSTRLPVQIGDNALIGGFIVTGTQPKKVIIRALGPSVPTPGTLADPTLELFSGSTLLETNDNWEDSPNKQAIIDSTIPPSNKLEAAIVRTLPANGTGYTAIVRGANNGTGIGVVEAYDLDRNVDSKLANISTRGSVQTGDDVLIAGTIILGEAAQKVLVRAIGPSLTVPGKLEDPILELRDANGGLVRGNDNWRTGGQEQEIINTTIPPPNDLESAIVATLPAGGASYTAIVRGVNDTTGVAVVEVYALN